MCLFENRSKGNTAVVWGPGVTSSVFTVNPQVSADCACCLALPWGFPPRAGVWMANHEVETVLSCSELHLLNRGVFWPLPPDFQKKSQGSKARVVAGVRTGTSEVCAGFRNLPCTHSPSLSNDGGQGHQFQRALCSVLSES